VNSNAGFQDRATDWLVVACLFACGLAGAMHFAKLSLVMGDVAAELQLGSVSAGFAVSILGMIGIFFAIASGTVVTAIGLRLCVLLACFGGACVAALGAAAPDWISFLISRIAEGFSHLLLVVCCPALMSIHASKKDKPIVLALWGCFFGTGFAIASAVSPIIVQQGGWRGLLLAHAAFIGACGLAAGVALWRSGYADPQGKRIDLHSLAKAHRAVLTSGRPLRLAATFCAYTILFLAVLTFLRPFLMEHDARSENEAARFIAFASLLCLAFTLGAGFLRRIGMGFRNGITAAFVIVIFSGVIVFSLQPTGIWLSIAILCMMAGFGLLPGFVFSTVPEVAADPARAALAYGAIALFGNIGTFCGTPLFAFARDHLDWHGGSVMIFLASFIGIGLAATVAPKSDSISADSVSAEKDDE
jgi:MFS transporter, DHA1 family, inner membrane transport protein